MDIRETLENSIRKALFSLKIEEAQIPKINLEHPEIFSHGDYSTNIAMVLGKVVAQNPKELAERIKAEIFENKPEEIQKIEVAGPGFINFYLTKEFFASLISEIIDTGEKFGKNKDLDGKKYFIEHTQPNPFKQFHIGHLMNNTIGESITRIVRANGAEVKTATYHGDVGLHVAKTIWAIMQVQGESFKFQEIKTTEEKVKFLGEMYAKGDKAYEENKAEIEAINKKVFEKSDKEINTVYEWGRNASLEYFESVYKMLGSSFDYHFYESEAGELGKKTVLYFLKKGIFEESEGAIIFRGENYGLHTRVFINKDGLPTYEAKEVGLAEIKKNTFDYDFSVTVTANEQDSFFKVVEAAIGEVFPELKGKLKHISHGVLKLPSGKMSSRTGSIISADSLIDQTKEKVMEKIADREFGDIEKKEISTAVAIGAIKYSILKQATGGDIIFDFDKSLSFEGDSGPYLQYSYARAKSILRKAKDEGVEMQIKNKISNIKNETLEKMLPRFSEVVEKAQKEFSPHYIATYLIELAGAFNNFYANGKIVDREDKESPYKVALTDAFSIVLKNGLNLLGISSLERM